MSTTTGIEWTEATWNPVRGCSKVSEGCRYCYAMSVAARFSGPGQPYEGLATRSPARWTGKVMLVEKHLGDPLRWARPRLIFVNSMSDLFHEDIPDEWIDRIFGVMAAAARHTFQVLTKRPARMKAYMTALARDYDRLEAGARSVGHTLRFQGIPLVRWPIPNVWLGTSVESQDVAADRIPHLFRLPAAVRFLSCEPLIGPLDLGASLGYVDWVIAGGESGPKARPCHEAWLRSLRDQCVSAGTPYFLKQLGGWPDKRGHLDAVLDGHRWTQMPERAA
jgi:protein gp37